MSGGSYNYLFERVAEAADLILKNNKGLSCRQVAELRDAFASHLHDVARAMKEVEWVDSGDTGPGDEISAILRVLEGRPSAYRRKEEEKNKGGAK